MTDPNRSPAPRAAGRPIAPLAATLAALLLALAAACAAPPPADLVLVNGRIATVDPELGEVAALAARDGRIVAVGSDAEVAAYVGDGTRVIDLAGRRALPGFVEGHGHFTGIGAMAEVLDLRGVASFDEIVALVADAARTAEPGAWILGRGWHQEKWSAVPDDAVEGFPSHAALSAVSPDNPVALKHASGHASLFNDRAMEQAGISAETPDPPGGEILRDARGFPSGLFVETAQELVERVHRAELAERTPEEVRAAVERTLRLADAECLSKGVTSFQDAGSSLATVDVMRAMAERGELGVRLWVMLREENDVLAARVPGLDLVDVGDGHLTVRAIKRTLDGALGSRGAWLLEPYADAPDSTGLATASPESVEETARIAAASGWQLCVHAIGDRANREVLDLYARVLRGHPDLVRDHRWRIEHAQHVDPADVPRFAELGVVASMQGVHCTSDAPYVVARLGERRAREGAYVWRTFLDAGVLVTNGTDAPVEDVDPIAGFHASVTRRTASGAAFHPEQRMTRAEALRSYTIDCARAAFQEHDRGSLVPGKRADVVILSADVLTVPEDEIRDARVLATIVGGEVVYERPAQEARP